MTDVKWTELRALARARGLRGYTGLRKDELITFLWDNAMPERPVRPSNVLYDALKMVELTALAREHGLQGYSRLRKAGLILIGLGGSVSALPPQVF